MEGREGKGRVQGKGGGGRTHRAVQAGSAPHPAASIVDARLDALREADAPLRAPATQLAEEAWVFPQNVRGEAVVLGEVRQLLGALVDGEAGVLARADAQQAAEHGSRSGSASC